MGVCKPVRRLVWGRGVGVAAVQPTSRAEKSTRSIAKLPHVGTRKCHYCVLLCQHAHGSNVGCCCRSDSGIEGGTSAPSVREGNPLHHRRLGWPFVCVLQELCAPFRAAVACSAGQAATRSAALPQAMADQALYATPVNVNPRSRQLHDGPNSHTHHSAQGRVVTSTARRAHDPTNSARQRPHATPATAGRGRTTRRTHSRSEQPRAFAVGSVSNVGFPNMTVELQALLAGATVPSRSPTRHHARNRGPGHASRYARPPWLLWLFLECNTHHTNVVEHGRGKSGLLWTPCSFADAGV